MSNGLGIVENVRHRDKEGLTNQVNEWLKGVRKQGKKVNITEHALELIEMSVNDEHFDGFKFADTMISYQNVLANDGVTLEQYVNAIRFVSFLEAYEGNITRAYIDCFHYRDFVKDNRNAPTDSDDYKKLMSAASRYRKSPVVVNIMTQAEVPLYLMFQSYRYKAVNRLVQEMENASLARDRIAAADKLLMHLKPPENIKLEVDIGIKKDNIVDQYENMLDNLVLKQKELIANGSDLKNTLNVQNFVDAEIVKDEANGSN